MKPEGPGRPRSIGKAALNVGRRRPTVTARSAWHPRSALGRALRLAAAIQARGWKKMMQPRSHSPMVLLDRPAPPPAAAAAAARLDLNIQIAARVGGSPVWLRAPVPAAAPPPTGSAPVRPVDRPVIVQGWPAVTAPRSSVLETVRRVFLQHLRVETATRYQAAEQAGRTLLAPGAAAPRPEGARLDAPGRPAPPLGAEPQLAPIRQVVRPQARVAPAEPGGAAASGAPAPRTPPQPGPPPLDVERLTDQVIQVIDRRIIAGRERLGRI